MLKKKGPSLCRRTSWTYTDKKAVDKVKGFTVLQEQEVSSCLQASVSPQTCTSHFTWTSKSTKGCLLILIQIKQVFLNAVQEKTHGVFEKKRYGAIEYYYGHWRVLESKRLRITDLDILYIYTYIFVKVKHRFWHSWDSNMMKYPRHNDKNSGTDRDHINQCKSHVQTLMNKILQI